MRPTLKGLPRVLQDELELLDRAVYTAVMPRSEGDQSSSPLFVFERFSCAALRLLDRKAR